MLVTIVDEHTMKLTTRYFIPSSIDTACIMHTGANYEEVLLFDNSAQVAEFMGQCAKTKNKVCERTAWPLPLLRFHQLIAVVG